MNTNTLKKIYYFSTIGFTLSMLLAVGFYFFDHSYVSDFFHEIGYPRYLVYPLGIVKIMGLIGMWNKKYTLIREWAYAGYLYNCTLAFFGNALTPGAPYTIAALVAIALLLISYFTRKKVMGDNVQ